MPKHFRKICKECGKKISGCSCAHCPAVIKYETCYDCMSKPIEKPKKKTRKPKKVTPPVPSTDEDEKVEKIIAALKY